MSTLVASRGTIAARQMWAIYKAQGHTVTVTLRTRGAPSTDYATGVITSSTANLAVQGLLVAYTNREIDSVRVFAGDQHLYVRLADITAVPTLRDQVVLAGAVWDIVDVSDTASGAIIACQLRRPGEVGA